MILQVYLRELNELKTRTKTKNEKITDPLRWNFNPYSKHKINGGDLSREELLELQKVIEDHLIKDPKDKFTEVLKSRLRTFIKLATETNETTIIKGLESAATAIKVYLEKVTPHRWLFTESDSAILPFFVKSVKFQKAWTDNGFWNPPRVNIELVAYKRGNQITQTIAFFKGDMHRTVPEMLTIAGYYPENEESMESYREQFKRYQTLQSQIGLQMLAIGEAAEISQRWYSSQTVQMVREGYPAKVVLDDAHEDADKNRRSSSSSKVTSQFWGKIANRNGMVNEKPVLEKDQEYDEDEESSDVLECQLPIHPYLKVYDLDKHQWVSIYIENLKEYPWNKELINKLILPESDKKLISILMGSTGEKVEDIVSGKMSGVIVLATGAPGIGKTLTAEVFSESIEKPLYTVQCSQLGLNVDGIEEKLQKILNLASRWGAILLIDEADVYIRERGEDITQNAIVGVFLRLLEYYRGVLFMTSNRGDVIDDAIKSRATAWIRYQIPTPDLAAQIWKVQAANYGFKVTDNEIKTLVKEFSHISGRSIRNTLKLANLLSQSSGKAITIENVIEVSKYQALEEK